MSSLVLELLPDAGGSQRAEKEDRSEASKPCTDLVSPLRARRRNTALEPAAICHSVAGECPVYAANSVGESESRKTAPKGVAAANAAQFEASRPQVTSGIPTDSARPHAAAVR